MEIIALSDNKLEAAEILLENGLIDDAYYIGGYAFELLLKAKICKTLGIPNFFEFDSRLIKAEAYKPFKVHDLPQLMAFTGIYMNFKNEEDTNLQFKADWSVVKNWKEELRYSKGNKPEDVREFIESLKNMMSWLRQYL